MPSSIQLKIHMQNHFETGVSKVRKVERYRKFKFLDRSIGQGDILKKIQASDLNI